MIMRKNAMDDDPETTRVDTDTSESRDGSRQQLPSRNAEELSPMRMSLSSTDFRTNLSSTGSLEDLQKRYCFLDRTAIFTIIIALVGAGVSCAFLGLGLVGANRDQDLQFARKASEVVLAVKGSWDDYLGAALWIHEACRGTADQSTVLGPDLKICSREDFKELHEYLLADRGLSFQAVAFAPLILHSYRATLEQEAASFYAENYPEVSYVGFTGFETFPGSNESHVWLRSEQEFYVPVQYLEPVVPNKEFLGFDLFSASDAAEPSDIESVLDWTPVVTIRQDFSSIVPNSNYEPGYYIMLVHPGIELSNHQYDGPESASVVVVKVSALAQMALASQTGTNLEVYLFEGSRPGYLTEPQFLAWASSRRASSDYPYGPGSVSMESAQSRAQTHYIEAEPDLEELGHRDQCFCEEVSIAQSKWMVVVCHESGYEPEVFYVILGSCVIFVATLFLSLWFYSSQRKASAIQAFHAHAEAEKAALIVANAEKTAAQERELNEYLSHEVRNPLAAAMSASSFVASAVLQDNPLASNDAIESCRGDVHIIQSSLKFINDLLRSLLDMQKASSNRLTLTVKAADIYNDVLEPVRTILDSKHNPFEFQIECPEHLVLMTDHLRLKQVVMNLASNSRKFVTQGYIRIGARFSPTGTVYLFVEDSGPGVPQEKRTTLFSRYQDSLDSLSQGTGLGLALSKQIMDLMEGELYLDETFNSGVPGFLGSRFIIDLKRKPEVVDDLLEKRETSRSSISVSVHKNDPTMSPLPEGLSVLIVDDDMILRRLISRSLKRIAPSWNFQQAANGETALKLTAEEHYDVIFLDQYMASSERQLLGTETAHAMRAQGVTSIICGLSVNQIEETFLKSGANAFVQKPFPCEKEALTKEVLRVLETRPRTDDGPSTEV